MVAPAIATDFRPGQFITVAVGGPESSMLLRRAFSIHDVRADHGGTIEFVFEAGGPGTRWLATRRSRDLLDVVGPLGRPFPLPREAVSCLLVGVGHHAAALFPLKWMAQGLRSVFLPDALKQGEPHHSWQLGMAAIVLGAWVVFGAIVTWRTFKWRGPKVR